VAGECSMRELVTRQSHKPIHIAQLKVRMVASVVYWLSVSYLFVIVVLYSQFDFPLCTFLLTQVCVKSKGSSSTSGKDTLIIVHN
jgi:hypothetical protein